MLERTTLALNVKAFRFFYCTILSYFVFTRSLVFWETRDSGIFQGLLFLKPFTGLETAPWQMYLAIGVLCTSLLLAAIGWQTRLMLVIALLSHLNIFAPMDFYFKPYDDNIVFFNLLVMAFYPFPAGKTVPSWIFELIKLNLALVYFAAFMAKLMNSGWAWIDGYTLQSYLFERHLMTGNPRALFFSQSPIYCMLMSIGTLIAEGFFWVVLFPNRFGRLTWFFAFCGLFMHISMYLLMSINFKVFALSYLVFIPYSRIYEATKRRFPQLAFNS